MDPKLEGQVRVDYVCTNYNNSDDTIAAVTSLRNGDGQNCRVIVVDNSSAQEQLLKLQKFCENDSLVTLVSLDENIGYFPGLNIGLTELLEGEGPVDVVVVGNNDLLFPYDFCACVEKIAHRFSDYSVVSPDIVTIDGHHQNPHVIEGISTAREIMYDLFHYSYWIALATRGIVSVLGGLARRGDEDQHANAMEITQGHGSCYLLGPLFFEKFGRLWAPSFLFGEEYFLSLQLERQGEKVFYDPGVTVTHAWHSSIQNLPSKRQWELAREAHLIYRRHNPIWGAKH